MHLSVYASYYGLCREKTAKFVLRGKSKADLSAEKSMAKLASAKINLACFAKEHEDDR
jgi:hypothetical protein